MPQIQDFGNVVPSILIKVSTLEITRLLVIYTSFTEAECFSVLMASVCCMAGALCTAVGTVGCCPDASPTMPALRHSPLPL